MSMELADGRRDVDFVSLKNTPMTQEQMAGASSRLYRTYRDMLEGVEHGVGAREIDIDDSKVVAHAIHDPHGDQIVVFREGHGDTAYIRDGSMTIKSYYGVTEPGRDAASKDVTYQTKLMRRFKRGRTPGAK